MDFTPEEKKFLEDRKIKSGMEAVRKLCRECTNQGPLGVDIAGPLRVHMYAASNGNVGHARQVLADIPPARGLDACADRHRRIAACRGRVNISRRIGELKTIFFG